MTLQTQAVIGALLDQGPDEELYGLEIVKASGLPPGTIYPILVRLRAAGWIHDRWESSEEAQQRGRPPRHYYHLTTEGRAQASHAVDSVGGDRSTFTGFLARHFPTRATENPEVQE
jgi:DNA-binding PadR family transcriptional regulator